VAGFERYFRSVIDTVLYFGLFNALAALTLKLTAPGIPDFYQGTELPSLVLVDPDNRRPVDLDAHATQLAGIEALLANNPPEAAVAQMLQGWQDGRLKLYVTSRLLALRASHADAFAGEYLALGVEGARSEHVCAFARQSGDCTVIAVATRWPATLCGGEPRPRWARRCGRTPPSCCRRGSRRDVTWTCCPGAPTWSRAAAMATATARASA